MLVLTSVFNWPETNQMCRIKSVSKATSEGNLVMQDRENPPGEGNDVCRLDVAGVKVGADTLAVHIPLSKIMDGSI